AADREAAAPAQVRLRAAVPAQTAADREAAAPAPAAVPAQTAVDREAAAPAPVRLRAAAPVREAWSIAARAVATARAVAQAQRVAGTIISSSSWTRLAPAVSLLMRPVKCRARRPTRSEPLRRRS